MRLLALFICFSANLYSQQLFSDQEKSKIDFNRLTEEDVKKYFNENGPIAKARFLQSKKEYLEGNYNESIKIIFNSKKQDSRTDFFFEESRQLMIDYFLVNKLDSCIYYGQQAIRKTKDLKEKAKINVLLANANWEIGNLSYAEQGYKKALDHANKSNDSVSASTALNGLGLICFEKKKELNKALSFFKAAIAKAPISNKINKALYWTNVSGCYLELNMPDSALLAIENTFKTAVETNSQDLFYSVYVNKGIAFHQLKRLDDAEKFLKKAEKLAVNEQISNQENEKVFLALSDLYELKKEYTKSLNYFKQYFQTYNKRRDKETNKTIINLQEKYNLSEKQQKIAQLEIEKKESELERAASEKKYVKLQLILISTIAVILLLFIVASLIYRKKKNRSRIKLEKEKRQAVMDAVEKEKYRFSRELHDSLGGTLSMSKLLASQISEKDDAKKISELLQIAIDDTRRISRDMYPTVLKVSGLESAIGALFDNLNMSNNETEFDYDYDSENTSLSDAFGLNIYRICQELTNNTIKYANATRAVLTIEVNDKKLSLRYRDNGQGINMKTYKTGVGMNSIQERISLYNGSTVVKSEPNKGFEIQINAETEE